MPGSHPFSTLVLEQSGPGLRRIIQSTWFGLLLGWALLSPAQPLPPTPLQLRTNETLVFIGSKSLANFHQTAYFEALLTAQHPRAPWRFRDLTRDGDTAFFQPREINYPTPFQQAHQLHATLALIQFGQMESLAGTDTLPAFIHSLSNLLLQVQQTGARPLVLTPLPFLPSSALSPPITEARNQELKKWSDAILTLAQQLRIASFDVFQNVMDARQLRVWNGAENGWAPDELQHQLALSLATQFASVIPETSPRLNPPSPDLQPGSNRFRDPALEQLRQLILHKNQQWFHYSRPTNWAFLAGDRTEQLSSRDHLNPKIRWFPAELEEFVPIIANAEAAIRSHTQLHWGTVPPEKP